MARPSQQSPELLRRLIDQRVELVVIGGVAAISWGSTHFTRDLDVTIPFTVENMSRVLSVVAPLHARFYQSFGMPLGDRTAERMAEYQNVYLETDLGIVDFLGQVPPLGDFASIAAKAHEVSLYGRTCRILALDDLITVKEHVRRPKDVLVATELRAIRELLLLNQAPKRGDL